MKYRWWVNVTINIAAMLNIMSAAFWNNAKQKKSSPFLLQTKKPPPPTKSYSWTECNHHYLHITAFVHSYTPALSNLFTKPASFVADSKLSSMIMTLVFKSIYHEINSYTNLWRYLQKYFMYIWLQCNYC